MHVTYCESTALPEDFGASIADEAEDVLAELGDFTHTERHDRRNYWIESDPPPVSLQRSSANPKIVPVRKEITAQNRIRFVASGARACTTYASIDHTCPKGCPYKGAGCYAEAGASHLTMGRLNKRAARFDWSALEISFAEAELIDRAWGNGVPQDGARGGRDLRLHVGGEVSCKLGATALGMSARKWVGRGGGSVWTFTHRWREIERDRWGSSIAVWASCETPADLAEAHQAGYAAAITVPSFPDGTKTFELGDHRVLPCPAQTRGKTCVECRLCLDREPELRAAGTAIGFALHGAQASTARDRLVSLSLGGTDLVGRNLRVESAPSAPDGAGDKPAGQPEDEVVPDERADEPHEKAPHEGSVDDEPEEFQPAWRLF